MRALLCSIALVAAQEVYRFDFSLDDQPLSGEFTACLLAGSGRVPRPTYMYFP